MNKIKREFDHFFGDSPRLTEQLKSQILQKASRKEKNWWFTVTKRNFKYTAFSLILISVATIFVFSLITNDDISETQDNSKFANKVENEVEVEWKSIEEQEEQRRTYTYQDYKTVYNQVVAEAKKFDVDDTLLNKWIIRILAEEKLLTNTDFTIGQVVHLAKQRMEENETWKNFAIEQYGISITDEEVDQFITDGPEASFRSVEGLDSSYQNEYKAYAEALGLTLGQLLHQHDRDLHERNVIWLKLQPMLAEKYSIEDNNLLLEKYQEEINEKK